MLNLSKQEIKELTYIVFVAMSIDTAISSKKSYKNSIIPELLYILEVEDLLRLTKYFPKQHIRIPSEDELKRFIKVIMYYYYREIKDISEEEVIDMLGLKLMEVPILQKKITELKGFFKSSNFKIPDELCKTKFMQEVQNSIGKDA